MPVLGTLGAASSRGFGMFYDSGGPYWLTLLGTSSSDFGTGVTTDTSGNVIICAAIAQEEASTKDICLAKYNASGILQWQRKLYDVNEDQATEIVTDSSGNIYVSGYSNSPSTTLRSSIIAKYTTSGMLQWQRQLGASGFTVSSFGIAVDLNENAYITGSVSGSGGGLLVAKYNSSGTLQWQRDFGTEFFSQTGHSIVADSDGNVYICGITSPGGVTSTSILKYNTSGTLQWQRTLSTSAGYSISIDTNNIYICGQALNGNNILIAKYNTSGVIQWQRTLTGLNTDTGYSVKTDIYGNVYLCGYSTSSGIYSMHIAKYNSSGIIQWQRRFAPASGSPVSYANSIATDNKGNFYICGVSNNMGLGGYDVILAKLPGDGSKTGTYLLNGVSVNYVSYSLTDSASSFTDSASSSVDSASTLTDSASTLTDSVSTLTSALTMI